MGNKSKEELLKELNDLIKREERWVLLEGDFIAKLRESIDKKDERESKKYSKICHRTEKRVYKFCQRVKTKLDLIKEADIELRTKLDDIESKLDVYNNKLLAEVSDPLFGGKGTIPKLLEEKPINWEKLEQEAESAYENGIQPMIALLEELKEIFGLKD